MISYPFIDWLASYPKSGNTWVRTLLNAYKYLDKFHLNTMDAVSSEPKRPTYMGLWLHSEPFDIYDWAVMRPVALRQWVETHRTQEHFVLKTHCANAALNDMPLIPAPYTRKALYITRDPRDVLVSAAKYFRNDTQAQWDLMRKEDHILGAWEHQLTFQPSLSYRTNVVSWLTETRYPVAHVRYEDILEDPVGMFTSILEFYEVEVEPEKVKLAVELSSFDRMQKAEQKHGFRDNLPQDNPDRGEVAPFFRAGTAGQWKTELDPELADAVYREYADIPHLWGVNPEAK